MSEYGEPDLERVITTDFDVTSSENNIPMISATGEIAPGPLDQTQ